MATHSSATLREIPHVKETESIVDAQLGVVEAELFAGMVVVTQIV
jgi:hypothetical protein